MSWCDRLVRGLAHHEFEIYALGRSPGEEAAGPVRQPAHVCRVRTAPLWGTAQEWQRSVADGGGRWRRARAYGRHERALFSEHFAALTAVLCTTGPSAAGQEDRFASGLYGLAELARDHGGLPAALRSETAVRVLDTACRAPGALPAARRARLTDLLALLEALERALRPLSLDWYGGAGDHNGGLGGVDLCHAASGGAAALAGLLAGHFHHVPLLLTEYGVQLRRFCLARAAAPLSAPVRALLASLQNRLAAEIYAGAALITPGNAHARRWQERCGADRAKLRTVHPGMDAEPFSAVADADGGGNPADPADGRTLLWTGRIAPAKDLVSLLHAFARVREAAPGARLRIVGAATAGAAAGTAEREAAAYAAHCRALAAQLFPDEAESPLAVGENPVSFEEVGSPECPGRADAYAGADVVVLSSVVEGFPTGLVEAMFSGRATVSTDTGAVCEVIGGTGLVVPARNPRALADACTALLRDPRRRARLGAAARARALELFTVEQNIAAFRGIYLELMSHRPAPREAVDDRGPLPFSRPPEAHIRGRWTARGIARPATAAQPVPACAAPPPQRLPSWAAPGGPTGTAHRKGLA